MHIVILYDNQFNIDLITFHSFLMDDILKKYIHDYIKKYYPETNLEYLINNPISTVQDMELNKEYNDGIFYVRCSENLYEIYKKKTIITGFIRSTNISIDKIGELKVITANNVTFTSNLTRKEQLYNELKNKYDLFESYYKEAIVSEMKEREDKNKKIEELENHCNELQEALDKKNNATRLMNFASIPEKWLSEYEAFSIFTKKARRLPKLGRKNDNDKKVENLLVKWCLLQQQLFKKHKLSAEQIKMLDDLEYWCWSNY